MDVWIVVEYTNEGDFYVNSVWADAYEARKAAKHRMEVECENKQTYHQIDYNTWSVDYDDGWYCVEVVQRYLRH